MRTRSQRSAVDVLVLRRKLRGLRRNAMLAVWSRTTRDHLCSGSVAFPLTSAFSATRSRGDQLCIDQDGNRAEIFRDPRGRGTTRGRGHARLRVLRGEPAGTSGRTAHPAQPRTPSRAPSPAAHQRGRVWRGRAKRAGWGGGWGAEGRSEPFEGFHENRSSNFCTRMPITRHAPLLDSSRMSTLPR